MGAEIIICVLGEPVALCVVFSGSINSYYYYYYQ